MTRAERIRRTAKKHPDWSCIRIGEACGCRDSYVRVVLRQRVIPGGYSKSDIAYAQKKTGGQVPLSTWRYRNDPRYLEAQRAYRRRKSQEAACPPG